MDVWVSGWRGGPLAGWLAAKALGCAWGHPVLPRKTETGTHTEREGQTDRQQQKDRGKQISQCAKNIQRTPISYGKALGAREIAP